MGSRRWWKMRLRLMRQMREMRSTAFEVAESGWEQANV